MDSFKDSKALHLQRVGRFNREIKPTVTIIDHVGDAPITLEGRRNGKSAALKVELIRRRVDFLHHANNLVAQAALLGVVLTVEQKPLLPLAMGHHETLVSIRPVRNGGAP
jgi:hypothetical protein